MRPDKATVYEVFQLEKRYVVPLYQRPYVWKEDDNWAPLWEDVETKAHAMTASEAVSPHFLGAIVLSQARVGLRQIAASQVIDGQQRLTTLQVLLAAFRDAIGELSRGDGDDETKETLGTIFKMLGQITEHPNVLGAKEDRFKVWPTNADRTAYEAVMTARSRAALDARFPVQYVGKRKKTAVPGPLLVEAYRFFEGRVRTFLTEAAATRASGVKDGALGLFEAIRHGLQLVVIDLEEGDDPQVIFETLNARGEPLLPSDLIRNVVFHGAGRDADALYEQHWHEFDRTASDGTAGFWKKDATQGREKRPVLDLFFHSYLTSRAEAVVPIGHLFGEFRAWWRRESARPIGEVLAELRRYGDAYRSFHEPGLLGPDDERLATFVRRLRILDTAMVYPVLLFLVVEAAERLDRTERDAMLVDLESFLVRRWICGVTAKNYNRFFPALVADLRREQRLNRQFLRARLARGSGVDRWPTDKEFEPVWHREPAYHRLGSPGVRMVLAAIHGALLSKKQERVEIPHELTVEHVMPLAWRNHWCPPPEGTLLSAGDESAQERRDRLLHAFGNLTLLTHELNSNVRDDAYVNKRPEITKQSLLLLNAYFQEIDSWDEDRILERSRLLLEHAKRIWPSPPEGA